MISILGKDVQGSPRASGDHVPGGSSPLPLPRCLGASQDGTSSAPSLSMLTTQYSPHSITHLSLEMDRGVMCVVVWEHCDYTRRRLALPCSCLAPSSPCSMDPRRARLILPTLHSSTGTSLGTAQTSPASQGARYVDLNRLDQATIHVARVVAILTTHPQRHLVQHSHSYSVLR